MEIKVNSQEQKWTTRTVALAFESQDEWDSFLLWLGSITDSSIESASDKVYYNALSVIETTDMLYRRMKSNA